MKKLALSFLTVFLLLPFQGVDAQKRKKSNPSEAEQSISLDAFKLRNVGPAFLSGRIADIITHPNNENVWYVATGSSGVWKTEYAGTTWTPIFDTQTS